MAFTRKSLAETIEGYDAEIVALQTSKRTTYDDYRHELAKAGLDKEGVKAEIEAFKLALRRKLAVAKSSDDAVNAKDDLVDEIFTEITAARAPRATRSASAVPDHSSDLRNMVPHDEDGVVIETEEISLKAPASKAVEAVTTPEEVIESEAAMLPQTGAVETLVASSPYVEAAPVPSIDVLETSSAGMEGEADRQPIRPDYTKPNPICADPDDCGIEASWHHTCSTCLRRRDAQRHQASAVH